MNIGVLSGRLLSLEGVIKTFILLSGAFVGQFARPLHQRLYIFVQGFFIVHEYSSSGQSTFNKSIAKVKGAQVNCICSTRLQTAASPCPRAIDCFSR